MKELSNSYPSRGKADSASSGQDSAPTPVHEMTKSRFVNHILEMLLVSAEKPNMEIPAVMLNEKRHETSLATMTTEFLLVKDNLINPRILSTYITKLGKKFLTATNGLEAVQAYKRTPHECGCILTDVSMPVTDGYKATRQIRAHERSSKLKPAAIIALTGLGSDDSQNEAFGSGMDLF
ncbi:hypothetical protein LY76DRAFT_661135 [Colletotrichum caudatum]|nr:hypothetical protein LY76DRAFT_661135 [Colletotrichum caudatum]